MQGLTLVVVLLFGLGAVLVMSAIETDPATGKSVPVLQTIANVWNNRLDFSQPGGEIVTDKTRPRANAATVYVPPSPDTATLAGTSYANASIGTYLRNRQS